jgi:hypothetical protein
MDTIYGRANYRAVLQGGQPKLEEAIRCGGLAGNKSKAIIKILERCEERNVEQGGKEGEGELSLDYLHEMVRFLSALLLVLPLVSDAHSTDDPRRTTKTR